MVTAGCLRRCMSLVLALFANSLRCNDASAVEGRPSMARLVSSRQPVTCHLNKQIRLRWQQRTPIYWTVNLSINGLKLVRR
jgi:hypothetical protein